MPVIARYYQPSDSGNGNYEVDLVEENGIQYYTCRCKNWTVGKHQRGLAASERIPCKHILREQKKQQDIQTSSYAKTVAEPLTPYTTKKKTEEPPTISQAEALLRAMKTKIIR